jgi:hypothetical protein
MRSKSTSEALSFDFSEQPVTKYGQWIVIGEPVYSHPYGKKRGPAYLLCRCECGTVRDVCRNSLVNGASTGCGCTARSNIAARNYKHGAHTRIGTERLYHVWSSMKDRCNRPKTKQYENYGGRGIFVCEEWQKDYAAFREWALLNSYAAGLQIDRIDNDGPYSPSNCRWITQQENLRNRSNNLWISAFGERKCYTDWSKDPRCKVSAHCLQHRVRRGIDPETAMTHEGIIR